MRFLEKTREIDGRNIAADFAALLSESENLREHGLRELETRATVQTDSLAGEQREQNAAGQLAGTARIFGESQFEAVENRGDGFTSELGGFESGAHFAEANFAEGSEQLFLAGKIIKEGAFADVGGLGDFLDSGGLESALGDEMHGGVEEALAHRGGMALAAGEAAARGKKGGRIGKGALGLHGCRLGSTLTLSQ